MFRAQASFVPLRFYTTSQLSKPPLKSVAEVRRLTEVSITKARGALAANNNDIDAALQWIQKDLVTSGAQKAAKLEGRTAREGLISVSVLSSGNGTQSGLGSGGVRAAMVELNCETDFVARNDLFEELAAGIAHTAAFMSDPVDSEKIIKPFPLDLLNNAPLILQSSPHSSPILTVGDAVRDLMAKVGERVSLRRALAVVQNPPTPTQSNSRLRLATYLHGSTQSPLQGRTGTLAVLALKSPRLSSLLSSAPFLEDLGRLERSLARQIVGLDARIVRSPVGTTDEHALYDQPFMMLSGDSSSEPVQLVLRNWARRQELIKDGDTSEGSGLEVLDFAKWKIGEVLDDELKNPC